jgi:hypothetical protein
VTAWLEPRFIITLLLIGLFGFAYIQDPSDDAMKGAIIAAFSAAYGFWIGSKENEKATENTGRAFDAITAAVQTPSTVRIEQPPDNPVPVEERNTP